MKTEHTLTFALATMLALVATWVTSPAVAQALIR
jgi:hypothetical protein